MHESAKRARAPWNDRTANIELPQCLPIFVKSSRRTRVAIIAGPVNKRGDGSVGRCGSAAPLCELRKAWGPPLGGCCEGTPAAAVPATSGHWRIGSGSAGRGKVLAVSVVLPSAPVGCQYRPRQRRQVRRTSARQRGPILWAALSASQCATKLPRDSYRTNSSRRNQRRSIGGSRRIPCAIGA